MSAAVGLAVKPAACGLFLPFVGISVAIEVDGLRVEKQSLDFGEKCVVKLLALGYQDGNRLAA